MAKTDFTTMKCYKVLDTATWLETGRYQLWASATGEFFYMDCNVVDANGELTKYADAAALPALWATEVLVDCDVAIEKLKLCERVLDASGNVVSKTEFLRWFAVSVDWTTGTIAAIVVDTLLDGSTAYVVTDPILVGECPEEKVFVDGSIMTSWPTAGGTVTIPSGVRHYTIESVNLDATEQGEGFTIAYDGATTTVDAVCACKWIKMDADKWECFYENGTAVVTAWANSIVCVTYII